jgi:hypothetical protein
MKEKQQEAALRIQDLEAQNSLLQKRAEALEEIAAAARKENLKATNAAEDRATEARHSQADIAELQQHIKLLRVQLTERSVHPWTNGF